MKKILTFVTMLAMSFLLTGCFERREQVADEPVVVDEEQQEGDTPNSDTPDEQIADEPVVVDKEQQDKDEMGPDGEFDPNKFQDEDIDEVMGLLEELLAE